MSKELKQYSINTETYHDHGLKDSTEEECQFIPVNILARCFTAIQNIIVKFIWKDKGTKRVEIIF